MPGSRLARSRDGALVVVVVTTPDSPLVAPGTVLRVLGTEAGAGPDAAWQFTGERTGRPNRVTMPRRSNRDPLPVDA